MDSAFKLFPSKMDPRLTIPWLLCAIALSCCIILSEARCVADITSTSFNGTLTVQIETRTGFNSQTASTILDSDSINVAVNGSRQTVFSQTRASLTHNWDGSALTATSVIDAEKTRNARRGGQHLGQSQFIFQFTTDSVYDFSLDGSYGFLTANDGNDFIGWSLVGGGLNLSGSPTQNSAGIVGESFFASGRLGPGTYTLTLQSSFDEDISRTELRQAGWTLNEFRLTAVPEPHVWALLGLVGCLMAGQARFRRCC